MAILSILLTVVIVAVSILIVLIVLLQRPKQEGLGAAFGGGTLDSALGAHTTDVLQKMTSWLGVIFFVSAIALAMIKAREFRASAAKDVLEQVDKKENPQAPGLPPAMSDRPGQQGAADPAQEVPGGNLPTQGNTLDQSGSAPIPGDTPLQPRPQSQPAQPLDGNPLDQEELDGSSLGGGQVNDSLIDESRIDGVNEAGDDAGSETESGSQEKSGGEAEKSSGQSASGEPASGEPASGKPASGKKKADGQSAE